MGGYVDISRVCGWYISLPDLLTLGISICVSKCCFLKIHMYIHIYIYTHHRRDPYKNKFSFQHGVCPSPCLLKADCIASSFHPSVMERKALAKICGNPASTSYAMYMHYIKLIPHQ